jgi:hypothetical protein
VNLHPGGPLIRNDGGLLRPSVQQPSIKLSIPTIPTIPIQLIPRTPNLLYTLAIEFQNLLRGLISGNIGSIQLNSVTRGN